MINSSLDAHFPAPTPVRVIAEPGRFFVSSAYTLACCIHSIRVVPSSSPELHPLHYMYFIDDGVYGSFNCILYDHQRVRAEPLKGHAHEPRSSSVWGPTCDGLDNVVEECLLPVMGLGDWVVFEDMGAYTLPVASPFNGFPVPKVHVVATEEVW